MGAGSLQRLAAALAHYQRCGYVYVECPWFVDPEYLLTTCSPEQVVTTTVGSLVGSAEQAFISLDHQGKLRRGRYVGYTPCFRNEGHETDTHRFGFNKIELYQTDDVSDAALQVMIDKVRACFYGIWPHANCGEDVVETIPTNEGFDLMIGGIEVGSYGRREWKNLTWLYGTGLAEPRFGIAMKENMAVR